MNHPSLGCSRLSHTKARALTLALLPLALTPKNNEIGRALKARIMEVEEELTAARNTARPKNDLTPR